ncbi:hypothetical protein Tco_1132137 [Tanacetum coccineum]|uniref:Reverse transcriptase domain-containing protein n=1 Tax=Tanacetum coccineum TaxID=301880 RepID=A0ABQ5JC63_9ASTR
MTKKTHICHTLLLHKITSTLRYPNVPTSSIKLMLFPSALEGAARIWFEKEPPRSIQTWLRLGIDSKDLLEHVLSWTSRKLHQLDTFYNDLNVNDQDSLNSAADYGLALLLDKKTSPVPAPAPVKAIEQSCVTCGGGQLISLLSDYHWQQLSSKIQEFTFFSRQDCRSPNFNHGKFWLRPPPMANQIRTHRSFVDVHGEEMTLRHDDQSVTFERGYEKFLLQCHGIGYLGRLLDIGVRNISRSFGFSEVLAMKFHSFLFEPIVMPLLPTSILFEGSDFILEEIEAELSDTSYKSGIDDAECDLEKDILLLEAILNSEPLPPLPNHANYFPGDRKELKICEAKNNETSMDEPSEVELKDLPPHLEYAFLEVRVTNQVTSIIVRFECRGESRSLKVLQSHKRSHSLRNSR